MKLKQLIDPAASPLRPFRTSPRPMIALRARRTDVAQIFNLPYRRFATCETLEHPDTFESSHACPMAIRRYRAERQGRNQTFGLRRQSKAATALSHVAMGFVWTSTSRDARASILALFIFALATLCAPAQTNFTSGSNGSYGAMNITADTTLDLPANGVFHCTTINVDGGRTLRFNRNALNTPVYLLATGDVTINGVIDVSGGPPTGHLPGPSGPGGFDGGFGGFSLASAGDGKGPGAGRNGIAERGGGFWQPPPYGHPNPAVYGNALLSPLIGGSGGAGLDGNPGAGGAGGGGAILIASTTRLTVSGTIQSLGGTYFYGSGSGGAIRLVSPVVTGSGSLNVPGGDPGRSDAYNGSAGRIRIDCLDRLAFRSIAMPVYGSRGSQMFVFPSVTNRLDIVQVGTQSIPVGASNAVQIALPPGPSTNLNVTVRASGFTNDVPIHLVVTPENGPSASFDAVIPVAANPAQTNVIVLIPSGTISTLNAWTR